MIKKIGNYVRIIKNNHLLFSVFFFLTFGDHTALYPIAEDEKAWHNDQNGVTSPSLKVLLLLEKRSYQVGEPIFVEVRVINETKSDTPLEFYIYKESFNQFRLTLSSSEGILIDESLKFKKWRYLQNSSEKGREVASVEKKKITLATFESFSTRINITDWFKILEPSLYFVEGIFSPNIQFSGEEYSFRTESVSFHLKPTVEKTGELMMASANSEKSKGSKGQIGDTPVINTVVPPYEVVKKHIEAQIKKDWVAFLENVDVEKLLKNSYSATEIYERYQNARANEKIILVNEFKNYLIDSIDYTIQTFLEVETRIRGGQAVVLVKQKEMTASQDYVQKFNPITGQIDYSWEANKINDMKNEKYVYYNLELRKERWNIIHKELRLIHPKMEQVVENIRDSDFFTPFDKKESTILKNVLFELNSNIFKEISFGELEQLARYLLANMSIDIEIQGHTCDQGSFVHNTKLSKNRAEAVRDFLINYGVEGGRLTAVGYGESRPLNKNRNESEREQNRRVEIVFKEHKYSSVY